MCGIAGFITSNHQNDIDGIVSRMASAIQHRGPDDHGTWVDQQYSVALGHRRLSVLDLSPAGKQPMVSASGRWVIAYNGEIYNHLDLRRGLETEDSVPDWRGHADTETILHIGIERWHVRFCVVGSRREGARTCA
jgi:asparagine synthase (glutamine-hydrolysing)